MGENEEKKPRDYRKLFCSIISPLTSTTGTILVAIGKANNSLTLVTVGVGFCFATLSGLLAFPVVSFIGQIIADNRELRKEIRTKEKRQNLTSEDIVVERMVEADKLNDTPEAKLKKKLSKIADSCCCIEQDLDTAISQINEVVRIEKSIANFEEYAHKKAPVRLLKEEYEQFKEGILQNVRDIIAICTIGDAENRRSLTEEEILSIEDEVKSSQRKIEKFHDFMRKTGKSATQLPETDVFSEISLNASIKATENFYQKSPH